MSESSRTDDDGDDGDDGSGRQDVEFLAPITGLLSIVFAVMAGASLSYALSRPPVALLVPAGLAAASVGCIVLKRRFQADEGDDGGAGDEDDG